VDSHLTEQRLKVNDHDLKIVAWVGSAAGSRSRVNDHDLKLVAWIGSAAGIGQFNNSLGSVDRLEPA
jgi:hypothetical protein